MPAARYALALTASLVLVAPVPAATDPAPTFSGFLDVQWRPDPGTGGQAFSLGQVECDVDGALSPRVGYCIAPAWDPAAEAVGLGTAVVSWQRHEGGLGTVCRDRHADRNGVVVGRQDIPFGIDWMLNPSPDRPLVTVPAAVARSHGSWNADGVVAYAARGPVHALVHASNGFVPDVADTATAWEPDAAYGGRVGVVPWPGVSCGLSGAVVAAGSADDGLVLWGADLVAERGCWRVRAEGIGRRTRRTEGAAVLRGTYVAAECRRGAVTLVARWDAVWEEGRPAVRSVALGAGRDVAPGAVLRAQADVPLQRGGRARLVAQLAVGF